MHFRIDPSDCDGENKMEKKVAFLKQWKQEEAENATYKALIEGLREIGCNDDASQLCKLAEGKLATLKYLIETIDDCWTC